MGIPHHCLEPHSKTSVMDLVQGKELVEVWKLVNVVDTEMRLALPDSAKRDGILTSH